MPMTPEFQAIYRQITNSNIQLILLQDYYNQNDAAKVALFVEKFMQKAIDEQNQILAELREDNEFIKEQLQQILEMLAKSD